MWMKENVSPLCEDTGVVLEGGTTLRFTANFDAH